MKRYFVFIHLQFYFRKFYHTWGFSFWFPFFHQINLINWSMSYFLKIWSNWFGQTKMCQIFCQILLYTLSNAFDLINLIELNWRCISGLRVTNICLNEKPFNYLYCGFNITFNLLYLQYPDLDNLSGVHLIKSVFVSFKKNSKDFKASAWSSIVLLYFMDFLLLYSSILVYKSFLLFEPFCEILVFLL